MCVCLCAVAHLKQHRQHLMFVHRSVYALYLCTLCTALAVSTVPDTNTLLCPASAACVLVCVSLQTTMQAAKPWAWSCVRAGCWQQYAWPGKRTAPGATQLCS